ncbi:MAG: serine/threonine protein kinase, partial [Labilithrix sp.]|nr:serine/threonine protein kinase [Labilithrix sp.]
MGSQYAPGEQLPGTVYRVVRHLATGGMGSVYDVEDLTVGKRYVLKTLHPQLVARQDLAKRMEAEARTLGKLQHPNIVDVVTAGLTTDEQRMPFYVMERLNGQNLRTVIDKKGALDVTHAFRIAVDMLDALEHAHENAVIHRDVKPENIFLHRNVNGTTVTKLLDFGIMRLLDRKVSHTQGKFIGTLRYASPEQIFGGELGPPTDIYSLALVLYEMMAGRGPFDDIGDAYAIGAAHAQRPPPPLSTFVPVSPALEALVMSALAKDPQHRPRDCFSFAGELRRMLRDEEASPKSATQVNVLTSAPPTNAQAALAGTEASSNPQPHSGPSTEVGMLPPSAQPAPLPADRLLANDPRLAHGAPPSARPDPMALAATVASQGPPAPTPRISDFPHLPHLPQLPPAAGVAAPGGARASGLPAVPVDRAAETRASAPVGATMRLGGHNGTAVDDELHGAGRGPALFPSGAPPGAPAPFAPTLQAMQGGNGGTPGYGTPRGSARPGTDPSHHAGNGTGPRVPSLSPHVRAGGPPALGLYPDVGPELGFDAAPASGSTAHTTGPGATGPIAGEANTRPPPPRSLLVPMLLAGVIGLGIVGGAVVFVTRPFGRADKAAARAETAAAPTASAPGGVGPSGVAQPASSTSVLAPPAQATSPAS